MVGPRLYFRTETNRAGSQPVNGALLNHRFRPIFSYESNKTLLHRIILSSELRVNIFERNRIGAKQPMDPEGSNSYLPRLITLAIVSLGRCLRRCKTRRASDVSLSALVVLSFGHRTPDIELYYRGQDDVPT